MNDRLSATMKLRMRLYKDRTSAANASDSGLTLACRRAKSLANISFLGKVAHYQKLSLKSCNVGQNYQWSDIFYWILKLRNITEVMGYLDTLTLRLLIDKELAPSHLYTSTGTGLLVSLVIPLIIRRVFSPP